MDGICTLANDRVYDQLIALLNSIEAIYGKKTPICVYPYDNNTTRIAREIANRKNVHLYNNKISIEKWDNFVKTIWDMHPTAHKQWQKITKEAYHRIGTHRRYCAFDGPFDRFLYMDADTLLLSPIETIFNQLNQQDLVVYDFQHKDLSHVYNINSPKLTQIFSPKRLETEIFCSGFYATKSNIFTQANLQEILTQIQAGEAEILYPMAPDQSLLNYMVMKSNLSNYNLALHLPSDKKTGCCVTSSHFQEKNHILYDKGNPLTYIHYIGISSQIFTRLCAGENLDFPYRETFLYYRYMYEPEKRPKFTNKPIAYNQKPKLITKIWQKLRKI